MPTFTTCLAASSAGISRQQSTALSQLKASQTPSEAMINLPPALDSWKWEVHFFNEIQNRKYYSCSDDKNVYLDLLHMRYRYYELSHIQITDWSRQTKASWPATQRANLQISQMQAMSEILPCSSHERLELQFVSSDSKYRNKKGILSSSKHQHGLCDQCIFTNVLNWHNCISS